MGNITNIQPLAKNLDSSEGESFFALQVALSSYPSDPTHEELIDLLAKYSSASSANDKFLLLKKVADLLLKNLRYVHYAVWDYTLVRELAIDEFASWARDITSIFSEKRTLEDAEEFSTNCDSYIVVTIALLSEHNSLAQWLRFYPLQLEPKYQFERKTIQTILRRMSSQQSSIILTCSNALFAVLPDNTNYFYSATQLTTDSDWDYLRPVY